MALADIVLNDGQGTPVAHTFAYITTDQNGRVIRKDMARTPDLPLLLTLAHNKVKRGAVLYDGHLFRIDDSLLDADNITVRGASVRVITECDPNIYSDTLVADNLAAFIRNYFSSANMRLLMRGSVG